MNLLLERVNKENKQKEAVSGAHKGFVAHPFMSIDADVDETTVVCEKSPKPGPILPDGGGWPPPTVTFRRTRLMEDTFRQYYF